MKKVSFVIVGAGSRGTVYSNLIRKSTVPAEVTAVADPREFYRNRVAAEHAIPPGNVFADWRSMLDRPRMADAAVISTQDAHHEEPAIAFARKGYHVLLEKPMAPTEAACRRIYEAVTAAGVIFGVCHVMRYTLYTRRLKTLVDSGALGEIVSLQHLEPVGYWHQAHSFVRGNWRNQAESTFMLMAKSCHDIDWIHYLMGGRCRSVASFGRLKHFRKEERPAGAADRCVDCPVEPTCPYSAVKIYIRDRASKGQFGWPIDILTPDATEAGVMEAIRTGPYGRCVYACDNDVVDHQVVIMDFEGNRTAAFTMTAFNRHTGRKTHLFGTRGEAWGDGSVIKHFDFLTDTETVIDTKASDASLSGGHGGGDGGIVSSFIHALATGDRSAILSGPKETLDSHLLVFAAERARVEGRVVPLDERR